MTEGSEKETLLRQNCELKYQTSSIPFTSYKFFQMKKSILLFIVSFLTVTVSAQYHPTTPPGTFRSKDNPYYWKNRPPYAGYWQQDVAYKIDATIDETTDILDGHEILTYWNNSPDTLPFVFFHLYQNMNLKGGHVENLNRNNNSKPKLGKYQSQGLGEPIEYIRVNGKDLKTVTDFTVMKVFLEKPILPGDSIVFDIKFKTYWDSDGSLRSRFKVFDAYGFRHYDGVHWYPRICVYDKKFGWDTFQHLGKEFYGDFGSYEVSLNFSSNYVIGATGTLQNRSEVLPDELRQKLDVNNFANKTWDSPPSVVTPYNKDERKTWKYFAENVHDFAFTADPTYRMGEAEWNGIKVYTLAQEPHASGWVKVADYMAMCLKLFSEDFGMYAWPQITAADARDGMEYPMLNLDGGSFPGSNGLYSHELGHEWFFGMVGNNETYRAALDEGFTQFLTAWALTNIDEKQNWRGNYRNKYYQRYKEPVSATDGNVYLGYLFDAIKGTEPEPLNTHSDAFDGALGHGGGYRHVYFKTATMLYNLQYVLGDTLFQNAMKHYFNQWKICHPYFEDFRNSIISYTHNDLNWFFDQWLETTKTIDYGIKCVKKGKEKDSYRILFKRYGRMEMPLDFTVTSKDDKQYDFYIPNTWYQKKTEAMVLPKWYGWDKLHKTYTATVTVPGGIKNVQIDLTNRLADVNMLDNSKKCPVDFRFDSQVSNASDWKHYKLFWRPDLWYNSMDGFQTGLHLEGNFYNYRHIFSLTAWYNTALLQNATYDYGLTKGQLKYHQPVALNFSYRTNIRRGFYQMFFNANGKYLDGLVKGSLGVDMDLNKRSSLSITVNSLYRHDSTAAAYALYPGEWGLNKWNNFVNLSLLRNYNYIGGNGNINISLRSSSLLSDFNYSAISFTENNYQKMGKLDLNTRAIIQYGTGRFPGSSALYLAGANPSELTDNKYLRSRAFVPADWLGYGNTINHFQQGGGLNLRGYAGYLVAQENNGDGNVYTVYKGNSGAAINAELEFDRLVKFAPKFLRNTFKLDTYLFGDAGVIGYKRTDNTNAVSALRADAGIGAALTIKRFLNVLEKTKPLTLRFDVPFFINRSPSAEPDYIKFRWVVGINRAF